MEVDESVAVRDDDSVVVRDADKTAVRDFVLDAVVVIESFERD